MKQRAGECKRCGSCCDLRCLAGVGVSVNINGKAYTPHEALRYLDSVRWGKKNASRCASLRVSMDGKTCWCDRYLTRDEGCRAYPENESQLLPGCGYRFEEVPEDGNDTDG